VSSGHPCIVMNARGVPFAIAVRAAALGQEDLVSVAQEQVDVDDGAVACHGRGPGSGRGRLV
jgi:hypothetical protein